MSIEKAFAEIGAIAKVREDHVSWRSRSGNGVSIDIKMDHKGREYFDITQTRESNAEIVVVDRQPKDRHLLLMIKTEDRPGMPEKQKFLCGHDEFHWFAASVASTAADVKRAKESLKPREVVAVQSKGKKKAKGGVKRQGEWFFIPKNKMKVPHNQILKNEPIQRGAGKPHVVEEIWRTGGTSVYVPVIGFRFGGESKIPAEWENGITAAQHARLMSSNSREGKLAKQITWRQGMADARVFGRGKVSHPDHSTIKLKVWHQIVPNTESSFSSQSLRFID